MRIIKLLRHDIYARLFIRVYRTMSSVEQEEQRNERTNDNRSFENYSTMFRLTLLLPLLLIFHLSFSATKKTEIVEGSGVSLDDYEDEDDPLAKITATTTVTAKTLLSTNASELQDEEFKDDFVDDFEENSYDETLSTPSTLSTPLNPAMISSTPLPTKFRAFFNFLARPPIAAAILVGTFVFFSPRSHSIAFVRSKVFRSAF